MYMRLIISMASALFSRILLKVEVDREEFVLDERTSCVAPRTASSGKVRREPDDNAGPISKGAWAYMK